MIVDNHCGLYYFGCIDVPVLAEVEVAEPTTTPTAPSDAPKEEKKPDDKESAEEVEKRARKPPAEGPCKRCGLDKPINRLMLCYPCWVKTKNEEKGWKEGQPHPPSCGCGLDCAFDSKTAGN